jgi:DNA-binding CsgD family transcriptional regulator
MSQGSEWRKSAYVERLAEAPSVPLTPAKQTALHAALAVLLSPLDAPDPNAWRGEVARTLSSLLGADKAAFQLEMPGLGTLYSEDYPQHTLDAYMQHYRALDVGRIRRDVLGLEVWNRELLHGSHLRAFYKSEIHLDFLVPNHIYDSMGLTVAVPGLPAPATVFFHKERTGTTQFGVRGLAFLGLLLPAFKAGVRDLVRFSHQRQSLASHLDSLIEGIRICDLEGRTVHQNPAFTAALNGKPAEMQTEAAISEIVQDLSALTRDRSGNIMALAGAQVRRAIRTPTSNYELRGSFLGRELLGAEVRVAISLQRIPLTHSLSDAALQERFTLTAREIEVVRGLAKGYSTKELAESCGISPHTARRHTEKVFTKLGVRNRAQIGPKINAV